MLIGKAVFAALAFCSLAGGRAMPAPAQADPPTDAAAAIEVYRLGPGDKVRISVFNEDTLSGEYEVDGAGTLSLPLIGSVVAAGRSVPELSALLVTRLKDGYLHHPSVAIQVLNYRPFYVLGEVKEPGKYPYASGMTVLNAIALAGGYTYRGKKGHALVIHAGDRSKREQTVRPTDTILPGDIIRVPERIF